jgi:DMSO/TMAO reductase YedYZ molybdopterin-dependent catalytic subunit
MKWSKLDTPLAAIETEAGYLTAWSDGGYTTNLPLEDVTDDKAWVAHEYDGSRLTPSTAAQPASSCRTCTSERARNGYGA